MIDTSAAENRALQPDRYRFSEEPGGPVQVIGSRSADTGSLYWPPRVRCPRTGGRVEPTNLATEGEIWAWTFVHVPWPGDEMPNGIDDGYGVALVDLDDGPRIPGVIVGEGTAWECGARVRLVELPLGEVGGAQKSILGFEVLR